MKPAHTHDGDTLTFGCPECIKQVRRDQRDAAIAEDLANAPLRTVTVAYKASAAHTGTVTMKARVPDHWTVDELSDYYNHGEPGESLDRLLDNDVYGAVADYVDFDEIKFTVGAIIQPSPAQIDQPDLFGSAS